MNPIEKVCFFSFEKNKLKSFSKEENIILTKKIFYLPDEELKQRMIYILNEEYIIKDLKLILSKNNQTKIQNNEKKLQLCQSKLKILNLKNKKK